MQERSRRDADNVGAQLKRHNTPQIATEELEMNSFDKLYRSIIADRKNRPERLNATLERIQEVVNLILGDDAPAIQPVATSAGYPRESTRAPVNEEVARAVVESMIATAERRRK